MVSTKLDIPNDVLNGFIAMNSNYYGDKIFNRKENIQQIELLHMKEHSDLLKKSNLTSEEIFYNHFAEAVGQREFIVKGYLTWSLSHQFQNPAEVVMHPDINSDLSVSPFKICFLYVYLQIDYTFEHVSSVGGR